MDGHGKHVGSRIAFFRQRAGLSTMQLARMIKKSQATVSRIENGKQSINMGTLGDISRALDVDTVTLVGHSPLPPPKQAKHAAAKGASKPVGRPRGRRGARARTAADAVPAAPPLPSPSVSDDALVAAPASASTPASAPASAPASDIGLAFPLEATRAVAQALGTDPRDGARLKALAERLHVYFRTGHISTAVLRALADPVFHQTVEEMAREWAIARDEFEPVPGVDPEPASMSLPYLNRPGVEVPAGAQLPAEWAGPPPAPELPSLPAPANGDETAIPPLDLGPPPTSDLPPAEIGAEIGVDDGE